MVQLFSQLLPQHCVGTLILVPGRLVTALSSGLCGMSITQRNALMSPLETGEDVFAFRSGKGRYVLLFRKPVESLISWSNTHISLLGRVHYSE